MPWVAQCLYSDGETVQLPDGRCYRARGSSALKTVAAEPGCPEHDKFYVILGRIYEPSPEDLALIQQIHLENRLTH
ncbi:hypothetical protein COOONC_02000 [Cooperia oncophora]